MKFFVPYVRSEDGAESVYQGIKAFMKGQGHTINDSRIYSISFDHNGKRITDTVGEVSTSNQEPVMAIFDAGTVYLVCTTTRGVIGGEPMLAGKHPTAQVVLFDFPDV
ncbi:hypothetical protein ACAW74_25985 [Fibrella sp. WM1]|uniref:hypothetical protein n=1 Tax=Fibrella musci TaxID=3242485 RepID=UPI0035214DA5